MTPMVMRLEAEARPARAHGLEETAAAAPAALRKRRRVIAENGLELPEEMFIMSPNEIVSVPDPVSAARKPCCNLEDNEGRGSLAPEAHLSDRTDRRGIV